MIPPRPLVLAAIVLASASSGCAEHAFVSPTTPQEPAPFLGPDGSAEPPPQASASTAEPPSPPPRPATPHTVTFWKTQDSNEWVAKNFKLQSSYAHVIAVSKDGKAPDKIAVGKLDLNAPPGKEATAELKVDKAFQTIAEAARAARGGDLIAILPGRYAGFTIHDKPDAGDEKYIHVKALGAPGDVVIDRPCPEDRNWMVNLSGAHHVIIQGLHLAGTDTPGDEHPRGPNAGIFVSGDFLATSALAHHIAIVGNFSHNHAKWGMHSVDSHTVLVQDNLFGLSAREHAAYISDGSDDYVIRRNVFYGSNASGLQVNVDPLASLEKVAKHPAIEVPKMTKDRGWALKVLSAATVKFGTNSFPDGRGFNYIIESNVMNDNGRAGGAALNLAGVRESLIQNNLIYGNHASGIAEWDNANPFDAAQVKPGPQAPSDVTGADVLPLFGCFSNVIRNNTVLMDKQGRPALAVGNGSWGTQAYNNVLINDATPSIELLNTSIWRFDGKRNVLHKVNYEGPAAKLKSLAISLPDGLSSSTGVTRSTLASSFVKPGEQPWVALDGKWWALNPGRPDFHPRATSLRLAGRGSKSHMPPTDIEGHVRSKADIGAYAAVR
jgi:hypothetical protein